MSNTLEVKTVKQLYMALKSYNNYMCEIPEIFPVLDEHLNGLSQAEFCWAFKSLQGKVLEIYDYLLDNPQAVGLIKEDKKTGEPRLQTSQHISCVKKLLYTIGRFSETNSDALAISMDTLMNAYMTYYSNCSVELAETINKYDNAKQDKFFEAKYLPLVFACLERFGFCFDGLEKGPKINITVTYPENPSVLKVLKAFAALGICRVSFGFDFTKFNYRVFAHKSDAVLPLEDLYSFCLLSETHQQFFIELNREMNRLGADYGECESGWYNGTLPCQYIYKNRLRVLQNIESGSIPTVVITSGKKQELIDKKKQRYIEYFKSMPEEYRRIISCRACRKDCSGVIVVRMDDKNYGMCTGKGAWWVFPAELKAIPYIVEAYKLAR